VFVVALPPVAPGVIHILPHSWQKASKNILSPTYLVDGNAPGPVDLVDQVSDI
jgi:hypothetical protein